MKKLYMLCIAGSLIFPALSQSINLQPERDNTIYANFPNNSNGRGMNFFAGTTNSGFARRGLIRFDIAGSIPACATITSVTLTLTCTRTGPTPGLFSFSLHKLLEDWGEGTSDAGNISDGDGILASVNDATWICSFSAGGTGCITAWGTPGAVFDPVASGSQSVGAANAIYSWSSSGMISDVQSWLSDPSQNFGWLLKGQETIAGSAKRFGSKQHTTATTRPVLTVTYSCNTVVDLKVFLEGYYTGGSMHPVRSNQNVPGALPDETDEITVELRTADLNLTATANGILKTDGTVSLTFPSITTPQYIVVKHRNSIETWSAAEIAMGSNITYDFTEAAAKAFGNNLKDLGNGFWGVFTGDLNQDGFIDGTDYPLFDIDSFNGVSNEYKETDMNGDGFVDGSDYPIFDLNSSNGVFAILP